MSRFGQTPQRVANVVPRRRMAAYALATKTLIGHVPVLGHVGQRVHVGRSFFPRRARRCGDVDQRLQAPGHRFVKKRRRAWFRR